MAICSVHPLLTVYIFYLFFIL